MTDISTFLQVNLLPMGIIMYMFVVVLFNKHYEPKTTRIFFVPIALLMLLVFFDNYDYYLVDIGDGSLLHKLSTIMGYNLRLFLLASVIVIINRNKSNRTKMLLLIPAFVNLGVTLLGIFTNVMFVYDSQGEFHRGPLGFEPHLVSLVYFCILLWAGVECIVSDKSMDALVIIFGCLLNLTATILETVFLLRGMILGTAALLIVFYYLCIHIEFMHRDILTGAWNRLTFSRDLRNYAQGLYAMLILDINDLKVINDNEGHDAGDAAIKVVARTMLDNLPKSSRLYRIGGDEFAVLLRRKNGETPGELSDRLQQMISDKGYACAFGFSLFEESIDYEEAVSLADKRMYENKKALKGIA